MKKFSDIKVGEKIFAINVGKSMHEEKDQYGNQYNDGKIDRSYEVHSIHKVDNIIYFNPTFEYSKIKGCLLSIDIKDYDKSNFEIKQTQYPHQHLIYLADESECSELQKQAALKEIAAQEKSIVDYRESCLKKIKSIRERYYSVLNQAN